MITAKELIAGTLNFISVYKRLPYYSDDDIEVEKKMKMGKCHCVLFVLINI